MRRGATLVGALLILLESCGARTDPWAVPGWSDATPTTTGGTTTSGNANGVGAGGATGFGSGTTGVGTGGTGTGAGGAGVGGTGIGGTAGAGTGTGGAGTGTGGTGTGTGGADTGTGGAGTAGTGGTGTGGAAGTGGGPRDGGALCFKPLTSAATPFDLYLLLDKSLPMATLNPPDLPPNTRWARITSAVDTFARRRELPVRMGLGFYPTIVPQDNPPACSALGYSTANVPILGADREFAIPNALAAQSPAGETWTRPALEGALSYAFYWPVNMHAAEPPSLLPPSVVLMTAALPTGCGGTVENLAAAAAASFRGTPRIRTHVVAVGAAAKGFDTVAVAGGTHRVYDASPSSDVDEIFARIARARLVCDIPFEPTDRPDLARLEVRARTSSTAPLVAIPRHPDAESCGAVGGWFLEPPTDPTMIMLCPSTCAAVVDAPGQVLAGQVSTDMLCVD